MKVVCVHLYNDFSGSPLVLSTVIKGFLKRGIEVDLHTSKSSQGFLSDLGVKEHLFHYTFYQNRWLRLWSFFFCQLTLFFSFLKYWNKDVVIYVNTLLPFGAALAGKLMGKKVIYHVHETSVNPAILKAFLKKIAALTANESIFVSNYLLEQEAWNPSKSRVVYNALSVDFLAEAKKYKNQKEATNTPTILMLCSLKDYKGVREFLQLARALSQLKFELVLNAEQAEIEQYFKEETFPQNLSVHPKQSNVHPFYAKASLVLNLSHPGRWVETFGMTLLEGMEYGLPAIAPPIGGPTEIVEDGINGYQIHPLNLEELSQKIKHLFESTSLYQAFSQKAKEKSAHFRVEQMQGAIIDCIGL